MILVTEHDAGTTRQHNSGQTAETGNSPSLQPAARHAEYLDRRFFGSLNGLRAVSVIAVIWHHAGVPYNDAMPNLLANGFHGVTLFFAISGFLIVTLLLRERERTGGIDLKAFFIRRSLRIFPLYYAVIAVYVGLVFLLERNSPVGREFFSNLPFFLTYTSNWFVLLDGRVIFYFAWSLAAEEQFYLVWPVVQKFFTQKYALGLVGVVIVVVTATQLLSTPGALSTKNLAHRIVLGIPLAICLGVVLAHALHQRRSFDALRWFFASRLSSLLWLVVLLCILNWPAAPVILIHVSAVMFVGACVYREDHALAPVLHLRILAHVGTVSYGVYLLHMLAKNAVARLALLAQIELSDFGLFVLTLLASISIASLSFRYFESIFLRKKYRFVATSR